MSLPRPHSTHPGTLLQSSSTLPPIRPHTLAKHDILRGHLQAWFPKLGRGRSRSIAYLDGFAEPGEYEGGEPGSPLIALTTLGDHGYLSEFTAAGKRVNFLFVARDVNFHRSLKQRIQETSWPEPFRIQVRLGEFEPRMTEFLSRMEERGHPLPPSLIFVDPFGPSGFSMKLLRRLAEHRHIDILINFNYVDLIRWILSDHTKHDLLDTLYGSGRWRPAMTMAEPALKDFLIAEYGLALEEVGWRSTNFEMVNNQNQTQYYLFFVTRHPAGMDVIKTAMRRVSPDGLFRYSDRSNPSQPRLFGTGMEEEYAAELSSHIYKRYRGREIPKEQIIEDNLTWHPRWIPADLTAALRLLENTTPPRINNVRKRDGTKRRRLTYPDGCLITFAA